MLIEESGADVHALTRDGYSPLAMAVARGHAELALTLIELHAGAVTDKVGPTKNTLLHLACESGNVLMLEVLLSSADVDPDPQNGEGVTPLQVAAGHGHLEAVKFLIDKGANVNRPDRHGLTTLAAAAYQGSVDLVHFLIDECGAKVDVLNDKGASPLHGACQKGHVEVARALVAAGADVNLRTKDGLCAVYLAAQANAPALVRFLADDCDADLTTATDLKVTPLHIAAWMGHTECARAIVELAGDRLGALLKAKDVNGLTPLHGAANQNHPECARMLVELGASACETTARGATPGDLAKDPDLQAFLKALEAEHKFEFEHKILFDELRGLAERLAAVEAAKGIAPPPEGKRKHRPQESLGGAAELPGMASADDLKKLQDAQKKLTALTTALQKETVDLREEIERLAVEQAPAPSGRGGKDKDKDLSDKAEKLRQLEDSIDEVLRRLADVEEVAATAAAAGKKGARADKAAGLTDEDRERLAHVDELVEVTRVLQEAHEELEGRVATLEAAPPPAAAATPVKGSRGAGDKGMEAVLERLTQLEAAAEESSAILPELEALDARVVELEALVAENAQLKESMEELQIKMMTLVPAQMEEVETRLLDAIDRKSESESERHFWSDCQLLRHLPNVPPYIIGLLPRFCRFSFSLRSPSAHVRSRDHTPGRAQVGNGRHDARCPRPRERHPHQRLGGRGAREARRPDSPPCHTCRRRRRRWPQRIVARRRGPQPRLDQQRQPVAPRSTSVPEPGAGRRRTAHDPRVRRSPQPARRGDSESRGRSTGDRGPDQGRPVDSLVDRSDSAPDDPMALQLVVFAVMIIISCN